MIGRRARFVRVGLFQVGTKTHTFCWSASWAQSARELDKFCAASKPWTPCPSAPDRNLRHHRTLHPSPYLYPPSSPPSSSSVPPLPKPRHVSAFRVLQPASTASSPLRLAVSSSASASPASTWRSSSPRFRSSYPPWPTLQIQSRAISSFTRATRSRSSSSRSLIPPVACVWWFCRHQRIESLTFPRDLGSGRSVEYVCRS